VTEQPIEETATRGEHRRRGRDGDAEAPTPNCACVHSELAAVVSANGCVASPTMAATAPAAYKPGATKSSASSFRSVADGDNVSIATPPANSATPPPTKPQRHACPAPVVFGASPISLVAQMPAPPIAPAASA